MKRPAEKYTFANFELRRWQVNDVPAIVQTIDESLEHLLPFWSPLTRGGSHAIAEELVNRAVDGWPSDKTYSYAITVNSKVVGGCSLIRSGAAGGLEIGYWLHGDWVGQGLATKSAAVLVEAGLMLDGIERIDIRHDAANTASAGMPKRLGFVEVERGPIDETNRKRTPGECGIFVTWRKTRLRHSQVGDLP